MDTLIGYLTVAIVILTLVDVAIIVAFAYVARKAREAAPDIMGAPVISVDTRNARAEAVRTSWVQIEQGATRGVEAKRLAVIEADRLIDHLLKEAGYEGEGALERMKGLPRERVATVDDLLAAHRFRNRLVHEAGFTPDDRALDTALAQFRAFLTEVGYL